MIPGLYQQGKELMRYMYCWNSEVLPEGFVRRLHVVCRSQLLKWVITVLAS
jgi:hypothetical protein